MLYAEFNDNVLIIDQGEQDFPTELANNSTKYYLPETYDGFKEETWSESKTSDESTAIC